MNTKPPAIYISPLNCSVDNRFVIKDADDLSVTWDGKKFSKSSPQIFADYNLAATEVQNILKDHFEQVKRVKFVVPVFVEVYGELPISAEDLIEYMSKATKLTIDYNKFGHGPDKGLVCASINWNDMEKFNNPVK